MTVGCIIFAYDGDVLYGPQAVLAAKLVIKHLGIPVSLVTDSQTLTNIKEPALFENIFIQEIETTNNTRVLDGNVVVWKNLNRSSAYDISPYDRTLVIDSDFLVLSDRLKTYLDSDRDFMICPNMKDLHPTRTGSKVVLHPASIPTVWATNIIFNKTAEVESIFKLVDYIRDNWKYYGALYKFNTKRFRNDYAFAIACHTIGDGAYTALPEPVWFNDKDILVRVDSKSFTFLTEDSMLFKSSGQDIHMMNKYDLLENLDKIAELAHD
jgi:hypothetical protein